MKLLLFILLVLQSITGLAQNEIPERAPSKLHLDVGDGQYYGMDIQKTPYFVKEKILQIYPSEKLNIECEVKGDEIIAMKVVKNILAKDKTITLTFEQQTLGDGSKQMALVISNPFDKQLTYKAMMYTPEGKQWTPTSIIPLRPGLTNYESWPHPIITLVLTDWKLETI